MGDFRDRYRLEHRPLGTGGFAEVFPATDRETGRRVALKRLRADRKWGDGPARLRREIEITRGLQHRNIMPVLDYDADQHEWYAMPLASRSAFDLGRPADEQREARDYFAANDRYSMAQADPVIRRALR